MADFTALKTAIQNAIKQNGNEEITGHLLQDVLLAIVTTLGDGSINNLISALNTESNARQLGESTLQSNINTVTSAITSINYAIANGCVYAGIATPTGTPATGRVFYLALTAGTYTNYGNKVVTQGINILRYNGSAWSLDVIASIDDAPTPSSNNLIKSGGAFDFVMKNGSAFDLSAYNNGTTYADLNSALTALNALPADFKKGGMSFKFVLSSDNNYIQYRYLPDDASTVATFTNTDNWAKSDEGVYIENSEFEVVLTDSNKRVLFGIRSNGDIFFGIGVPSQIKEYIYYKLKKLQLDIDKTLSQIIEEIREDIETLTNTKVDKVTGKSLIDEDYAQGVSVIENDEFFDVETDLNNNLLGGRKSNGTKFENVGYETPYLKTDEADIKIANLKEVNFTDGIPPQIQEYINSLINIAGGSNLTDPIQIIESYASKVMSFGEGIAPAVKSHRRLVVAHITDTHNDTQRLTNFANFVEDNSIVDFAIHTGDVDLPARWSAFFNQFSTKDIYLAIGNHEGDACNDHLNAYLTTNFLQSIANKGVTVTSHNAYYIDRTVVDGNGDPVAGNEGIIRFIFLNEYDYPDSVTKADMTAAGANGYYNAIFSQEQIDWFISVLKDAITNDYPVVVCSHQKPVPVVPNDKGFFQNPVVNNFASNNYHGTLLLDIINAFKTGGTLNKSYAPRTAYSSLLPTITVNDSFATAGTFIAWMDGHNHGDYIGYDNVYGNQLILNEVWGSAGVLISLDGKEHPLSDLPRNPDDITQDAFNVYVFDLEYSKVHVIRIGSNLNWEGKIRKYAAYSF